MQTQVNGVQADQKITIIQPGTTNKVTTTAERLFIAAKAVEKSSRLYTPVFFDAATMIPDAKFSKTFQDPDAANDYASKTSRETGLAYHMIATTAPWVTL